MRKYAKQHFKAGSKHTLLFSSLRRTHLHNYKINKNFPAITTSEVFRPRQLLFHF